MTEAFHKGTIRLARELDAGCSRCNACVTQCAFLSEYGTPGDLAASMHKSLTERPDPFGCSLCGLCEAVCPERLKPKELFLSMRRQMMDGGQHDLTPYKPVLNYEKLGHSMLLSLLRLPEGGDTVLFPGCALPSTRSVTVRRLFSALQSIIPDLGIGLGCCLKPSHDLGRQAFFEEHFGRLLDKLRRAGVRRVLTACPNCQKIFAQYGHGVEARTVYEVLAESGFESAERGGELVMIHDPCPQRETPRVREAVRDLAARCGLEFEEMRGQGRFTRCCGEGGMVKFVRPDLAARWTRQRTDQVKGRMVLTSCAGCVGYLDGETPTVHVLDVLFGTVHLTPPRPPLTYWSRLKLKWWFMRRLPR